MSEIGPHHSRVVLKKLPIVETYTHDRGYSIFIYTIVDIHIHDRERYSVPLKLWELRIINSISGDYIKCAVQAFPTWFLIKNFEILENTVHVSAS
jgi:hypothetical protein